MIREDLVKKLQVVSPALSDNDLLPVLKHFWFTGSAIMAFNDQIAISIPFKSEFIGAVPGALLLQMLSNSTAVNIDFAHKDANLEIKSRGNARFKLATMAPPFIFDMPEAPDKYLSVEPQPFLAAIDACLMSVGQDTSTPDQLGVTLIYSEKDKRLECFSTNNSTLSYAQVPIKGKALFERAVLPTAFCRQLIKLVGKQQTMKLDIRDDHALLDAGKGVTLFGRLVETDKKMDFHGVIEHHIPATAKKQLVHIPGKLELILERAIIITESSADHSAMKITVKASTDPAAQYKVMQFDSVSERGEAHDSMQVGKQHPNVTLNVEPRLLKVGYSKFKDKNILVADGCVVMASDDNATLFLVAARSNE